MCSMLLLCRYGYVTPNDVPVLLDEHIGEGKVIERLWRFVLVVLSFVSLLHASVLFCYTAKQHFLFLTGGGWEQCYTLVYFSISHLLLLLLINRRLSFIKLG